jgi:hypothetical protein
MAIRRFSTAEPGVKSNKFWDQDTQQGAMVPIVTVTGTGTTGGEVISLTNIPQTYQDLMLVANMTTTSVSGANSITLSFNTGTGNAYSQTILIGDGSSITSSRFTATSVFYPMNNTNTLSSTFPASMVMHFLNYANTTAFKSVISRVALDKNGSGVTSLHAGEFLSTAAINRITFSSNEANNFWTGATTFTLYGIKAGV